VYVLARRLEDGHVVGQNCTPHVYRMVRRGMSWYTHYPMNCVGY